MGVREGLLALLDDGPRYGYQLKTRFEGATGRVWPLNVGQVYTTLERLERDGRVSVTLLDPDEVEARSDQSTRSAGAAQKSYALTDAGRAELGAWWHAVPVDEPPPRDELMLKVLLAIEHDPDTALDVVTRQRTALLALLQQHRRRSAGTTAAGTAATTRQPTLAEQLVSDALVVRAEADLRWLDLCESRLAAARAAAGTGAAADQPERPR